MHVRDAAASDWEQIWAFFRQIAMAGASGVIGTVPEAFHHPVQGYVGLHVMHRFV